MLSVHEFAGRNYELQPNKRLMMDEIIEGMDELGVLLAGHAKGAYWYGSRLTIGEARELAPHNNATSLQVTAAVLGGLVWAIENPDRGLVEPEEMDHERVLRGGGAPISASWPAPSPTGTRCRAAASCSPRTSTPRTPGSSRTSGWCDRLPPGRRPVPRRSGRGSAPWWPDIRCSPCTGMRRSTPRPPATAAGRRGWSRTAPSWASISTGCRSTPRSAAVGDAALLSLTADPRPLELHLTPDQADRLRPACGDRLALEDGLRFYARPLADLPEPDPACRRMGPAELEPLRRFYAAHYPTTVFSAWMLDLPFVAIVEDGRPVAAGGVLARAGSRAMIGNFLVDPARRGEGLAGRVLAGLLAALRAEGVTMALLATNDLNPAACRVYERAGFALVERRVQLDLRAA